MDGQIASKLSYSWGGRFHLAYPVESEYGQSLKTYCDQLHNPKTVKAIMPWGNVPNGLACRDCIGKEGAAPEPQEQKATPDLKVWGDSVGEAAQKAADAEEDKAAKGMSK